jgi:NADH dehydrogenase
MDAVTGGLGFTGQAIARQLIAQGRGVITLTRRPYLPNPFGDRVKIVAIDYGNSASITAALRDVETLYNTAWVRFERGRATFEEQVQRTGILMRAARAAGVRRVVHISVVGADANSPLRYWAAKARAEALVRESGIPWAIVRPTLLFGRDDILVNNMAWFLRRLPVFGLPVKADCPVQPVHVDDVASLAVSLAHLAPGRTADAAGPERLTFLEMVRAVRAGVGSRARIVPVPSPLALAATMLAGAVLRDVVLTRDELRALERGLLVSDDPAPAAIAFSTWVRANGNELGRTYASELGRNFRLRKVDSGAAQSSFH